MNILGLVITGTIFVAMMTLIIWVGIYIALPIILLMLVASAIGTMIKAFMPAKAPSPHTSQKQQTNEDIIDVEFKEIK